MLLLRMAFNACHFLMRPCQRKPGGIVIEFRCIPAFIFMADGAISLHQTLGKLSGMNVLMAFLTTLIR